MGRPKRTSRPLKTKTLQIWTHDRLTDLKFRNKIARYQWNPQHQCLNITNKKWWFRRDKTIPSSLVRKAVSGKEKFLSHYYFNSESYTLGSAVEDSILPSSNIVSRKGIGLSLRNSRFFQQRSMPLLSRTIHPLK